MKVTIEDELGGKPVIIPHFTFINKEITGVGFNIERWYGTDIARVYNHEGNIIQYSTYENTNP